MLYTQVNSRPKIQERFWFPGYSKTNSIENILTYSNFLSRSQKLEMSWSQKENLSKGLFILGRNRKKEGRWFSKFNE